MENPNPIYFSDLIKPDNSITTLIAQLDELIKKYETVKTAIQQSAADTAKAMQTLSGATQEQRQQIQSLATESEKLTAEYKKSNDAESETYRRRQQVIMAVKEQQRIDKLIVEINNSKEGSYKRLSAQYRLNKIRLNEMSAEERRATDEGKRLETETRLMYEEMSRLQQATGKYTLEVGHYQNALKALPGPINQVVSGFSGMKDQLTTIGASSLPLGAKALQGFSTIALGTLGIVMQFVRYLTSAQQTLREFEQANADLSTILGVSRKDMDAMTQSALALGRSTEYTAQEVTKLQTELAKLGFGQGSIYNMQEAVLKFSTAVGANLADAAQVAGSTLRAFGLTSKDTEDVLATLAVATNKSALSFERIQTSIGTVFPIANAFGLTVKDTTALLGTLADAGFDASSAATATRNIILKMADANGELAKRMGGAVKSFDDIIDGLIKLRQEGTDLNDVLELTDKRSASAFSAFIAGAEKSRELRNALEDVGGELQRISDERLNTVEGSTKLLRSAWDGLVLSMESSNGAIKDTIDWLTKLLTQIQNVFFATQALTNEWTQNYVETFTEIAEENAPKIAIEQINKIINQRETELSEARGKRAKETAEMAVAAAKRAGAIVINQIQTEEKEKEEARRRQAELDQEEEDRKKEQLTKEQQRAAEAAKKQRIADLQAVINAIDLEIAVTDAGTDKMLELRQAKLTAQLQLELEQNRQKVESERLDEEKIYAKYDKQRLETVKTFNDEVSKLNVQRLQAEQGAIQLELATIDEGSEQALELKLRNIEIQRDIEIEQNRQKNEDIQQDEQAIILKYQALIMKEAKAFRLKVAKQELEQIQELNAAEFDLLDKNERQKTLFRLEQEKARLKELLRLQEEGLTTLSDAEIATIRAQMAKIDQERSRLGYNNLYELMGLSVTPEQQDALNTAIDSVKDALSSLADSWNQAAEAALNAANAQVEAAQKVLDAEIEAREKGYANRVESAQKELALAQKTQESARKEQEKAQKAQLAMDSLQQASSLVTATANIWKAFSGAGAAGLIAAALATATMWGSFAAAKIKASQVAGIEQYGEGTVELLQGGSHASGHDIDLGRRSNGVRRRAEGGEYFAIINKRNSRRYRDVIPDVINSFNDGTFADKYARANETMSGMAIQMLGGTDVSKLEKDVSAIKRQGEESRFVDGQGNTIVKYRNLTRKIKN